MTAEDDDEGTRTPNCPRCLVTAELVERGRIVVWVCPVCTLVLL